jgi:hypothetical protein
MNPHLQTLIVTAIVLLAVVYLVRRYHRQLVAKRNRRSALAACDGCDKCGH